MFHLIRRWRRQAWPTITTTTAPKLNILDRASNWGLGLKLANNFNNSIGTETPWTSCNNFSLPLYLQLWWSLWRTSKFGGKQFAAGCVDKNSVRSDSIESNSNSDDGRPFYFGWAPIWQSRQFNKQDDHHWNDNDVGREFNVSLPISLPHGQSDARLCVYLPWRKLSIT